MFALLLLLPLAITVASVSHDDAGQRRAPSAQPSVQAAMHAGHGKQAKPANYSKSKSKGKASTTGHCRDVAIDAYERAMHKMHAGMNIRYTGDADYDFVSGMIPHHQGAVDMALIVLKYGRSSEMKKLAQWIITTQRQEIGYMSNWLRARKSNFRFDDAATRTPTIEYKKAMDVMHKNMMVGYSGDVDVDFARGMIPHHQGAVDMAQILVEHGKALELRSLAYGIIRSQQQEIALMKDWLATQKFAAPAAAKQPKPTKKKSAHDHHMGH